MLNHSHAPRRSCGPRCAFQLQVRGRGAATTHSSQDGRRSLEVICGDLQQPPPLAGCDPPSLQATSTSVTSSIGVSLAPLKSAGSPLAICPGCADSSAALRHLIWPRRQGGDLQLVGAAAAVHAPTIHIVPTLPHLKLTDHHSVHVTLLPRSNTVAVPATARNRLPWARITAQHKCKEGKLSGIHSTCTTAQCSSDTAAA
jgi:hypothetical protein